jgi:hypothetical protein
MNFRMTLAVSITCCLSIRADDIDARLLKPFVTSQTAVVATLDLSGAHVVDAVKAVLKYCPEPQAAETATATIEKLRSADVKRVYFVVTPLSLLPNEWIFALAATSADKAAVVRAAFPTVPGMTAAENDGAVFFGASAVWNRIQQRPAGDEAADLLARIERTKPSPLSVVVTLPEAHRKAIAELSPHLPSSLGGGPTAPLVDGLHAIEANATTGERPMISVVVHARDATAAKQIQELATKGLELARSAPARRMPAEKAIRSLAAELKPTLAENRVELSIDLTNGKVKDALKGLADAASEHARLHKVQNDLKMIALAMHNYHDAFKSFPPGATVDKNGKPLLSWRVHILPFLDYNALYRKFKLDEPWDSEHNRKLVAEMPKEYAAGRLATDGKTTILGFSGPGSLFPKPGETIRIHDIKDGTSNTIMCLAAPASQAVVWTKPDDLSISDPALLSKVGDAFIVAVYCDGSAHTLPVPSSLKELTPRITINGREPIERP